MKLPLKKILTISGLVLSGLIIVFLVVQFMLHLSAVGTALQGIVSALRAILFGIVLTYLLYPLARFAEQFLLYRGLQRRTARGLSTAFTTAVLLAFLAFAVSVIIPQLVMNLPSVVQSLPSNFQHSMDQLSAFLKAHNIPDETLTNVSEKITGWFTSLLQSNPLDSIRGIMDRVATAAISLLNFIIGIIVMVYLLLSRDQFVGQSKKLMYATIRKRSTCDTILKHMRVINRIFSGFVSGKLLDSLVVGIICGVCLSILQIPYAMLISVIVGITNIIPVFGPFFGALPSIVLLLLTDPGKCLIFIIFIVILQQVDGNIIGPKILGDSTGLPAFWVLFALLLFHHLMGFWGMLLGVPLFASFYYLLREFVNSRLRKKDLPLATRDYVDIANIDENGSITYNDPRTIEFHPFFQGEDSYLAQFRRWTKELSARWNRKDPPSDRQDDDPSDPS